MCGRFGLFASPQQVADQFNLPELPALEPRYNIAPSEMIPSVGRRPGSPQPGFSNLRWGLVPHWVDDPDDFGANLVNARMETVEEKPSFRDPFRKRRCIIPASGFYEWEEENGKQPYFIRPREEETLLGLAALWEIWKSKHGQKRLHTATIITRPANRALSRIHPRMPVILHPGDYDTWTDPGEGDPDVLKSLLKHTWSDEFEFYPVTREVNKAGKDKRRFVEPLENGAETSDGG